VRAAALALVTSTFLLLAAGTAAAGTVGIDGDTLHYEAAPGEFNELYLLLQGGEFTVQDGTSGTRDTLFVHARPPCRRDNTPQPSPGLMDAYCPPAGVTRIAVELGDGNDSASIGGMGSTDYPVTADGGEGADRIASGPQADDVHGGPGNDTLTGNEGRDVLSGDEGDDAINAADALPDRVFCGPGVDSVTADFVDTVADDCELINIGPGQPQQVIMNEPAPPSVGTLLARGLRARLTCAAACAARTDLLLPARAKASSSLVRAAGSRLLATGRAHRGAAGRLTVVARLRPGAARRLRRLHPVRLTLRTTVEHGASTTVLQRSLRVRRGP
jgi:hemolysin type calcium-binding protein